MSRKRPRRGWRLVDMMPEELETIFEEGSVAYTVVQCDDLNERVGLITQQVVTLLALNKALLIRGKQACTSLVEAVDVGFNNGIITFRQAKYLRGLNRAANHAKHNPLPDQERHEDDARCKDGGEANGSAGGSGDGGSSPSAGKHKSQASDSGVDPSVNKHGYQANAGSGGKRQAMEDGDSVGDRLERWLRRWQQSAMAESDVTFEYWMRKRYPDLWKEYQRRSYASTSQK